MNQITKDMQIEINDTYAFGELRIVRWVDEDGQNVLKIYAEIVFSFIRFPTIWQ